MKKIILFILAILFINSSWAQDAPPEMFKFQALITKSDGKPVKNRTIGVKIAIRQSATNGTLVYREIFTPTTNNAGIINIEIGNGTPKYGVFSDIPWAAGEFFLKLRVDIHGGTNYTTMGASQLLSVPYALLAKKAMSVEGDDDTDPTNEIQTLTLEGDLLSLSDGGEVTLSSSGNFIFYYADKDEDGYGDKWNVVYADIAPEGFVPISNDCNDLDETINPNAAEIPNDGVDQNCDGIELYLDQDGDGYTSDVDCDDLKNTVYPGAPEICDDIDNNCNGISDEGLRTTYYFDSDGDGFGNPNTAQDFCTGTQDSNYVLDGTDCNDSDNTWYPGATETTGDCFDKNCDGQIDEFCDIFLTEIFPSQQDMVVGSTANITVYLNTIATFGQVVIDVAYATGIITGPATILIPTGSSSGILEIMADSIGSGTITFTIGSSSLTAIIDVLE